MDDITEPLRKPALPARTALLVGAGALVIAGTTWGGIAIAQSGQPADEVGYIAAEPSDTPTPEVPNVPPVAPIDSATATDLTVTVAGTGTDEDGQITHQGWNFGDGTYGDGASATHTYAAAGTYTVTFAVTDDAGATGTATLEVTVTAPPPPPAPPANNGGGGSACPPGYVDDPNLGCHSPICEYQDGVAIPCAAGAALKPEIV
jgi:hypothetical protein